MEDPGLTLEFSENGKDVKREGELVPALVKAKCLNPRDATDINSSILPVLSDLGGNHLGHK